MIHRITRIHGVRLLAAAVALLSFGACGGEAAKYSGYWKRDLYGEGRGPDEAGLERRAWS